MLETISKLFDISSSISLPNFFPLHFEEIFHVLVTQGQAYKKKWLFMT